MGVSSVVAVVSVVKTKQNKQTVGERSFIKHWNAMISVFCCCMNMACISVAFQICIRLQLLKVFKFNIHKHMVLNDGEQSFDDKCIDK